MIKINIKIIEVDQPTHTVLIKYTSENSNKSIDEYPAVAFQVTNYNVKTVEEFIEAIRPQVSLYVYQRDLAENPPEPIDLSGAVPGPSSLVQAWPAPAPAPDTSTFDENAAYF